MLDSTMKPPASPRSEAKDAATQRKNEGEQCKIAPEAHSAQITAEDCDASKWSAARALAWGNRSMKLWRRGMSSCAQSPRICLPATQVTIDPAPGRPAKPQRPRNADTGLKKRYSRERHSNFIKQEQE